MKLNFDNIFDAKPLSEMEVQDIIIKELNKSLPSEDIEYVSSGDGFCYITTKKDKLTIGGFSIALDEEDRQILDDNSRIKDVLDYSYNAQKIMRLTLKEENTILVNGERISVDKLIYKPLSNIRYSNGHFCVIPERFPEPFVVSIYDDVYSNDFLMKRIPNKSIANMSFESEDNQVLKLKYIIYQREGKMSFNLSYNLKYCKTVAELIKYSTLYNSFLNGKIRIGESVLKCKKCSANHMIDVDIINYWKKIQLIEKYLNVYFIPTMIKMTGEEQEIVDELFFGLVRSLPIRDYRNYSSFTITFEGKKDTKELEIGQKMYFGFEVNRDISLFGVKLELYCSIGIYNSKIKDILVLKNKTKVEFESFDESHKSYVVIKYFTSQDKLSKYRDSLTGKEVSELSNAKSIIEYAKNNKMCI